MKSFDEVWDSLEEGKAKSIILGNGFSQAWSRDIFSYENLLEKADFGERDKSVKAVFEKFDTFDFEEVMKKLKAASEIVKLYGGDEKLTEKIESDSETLKDALIKVIAQTHPEYPYEVENHEYVATRKFIKEFSNIFTLNYDLLLYWSRNMDALEPKGYETDDGFRMGRTWQGYETEQEVFFLHGGLHIYEGAASIKKHAYSSSGKTIIDQVRENLEKNKFPIFISEPTSNKKKSKIEHNPYLNYCFRALSSLSGYVFIHGHSMAKNDKHIFDQVYKSSVETVYVGIFGDENTDNNKESMANARTYFGRKVKFYDAATVPIWGNEQPSTEA